MQIRKSKRRSDNVNIKLEEKSRKVPLGRKHIMMLCYFFSQTVFILHIHLMQVLFSILFRFLKNTVIITFKSPLLLSHVVQSSFLSYYFILKNRIISIFTTISISISIFIILNIKLLLFFLDRHLKLPMVARRRDRAKRMRTIKMTMKVL